MRDFPTAIRTLSDRQLHQWLQDNITEADLAALGEMLSTAQAALPTAQEATDALGALFAAMPDDDEYGKV